MPGNTKRLFPIESASALFPDPSVESENCVYDTIKTVMESRRSVRDYSDRPVPKDLIESLIRLANWAPSPENSQNRRIVVVRNADTLARIKELLNRAFEKKIYERLSRAFDRNPKAVDRARGFFSTLGGAPVMLFAFAVPSGHGERIDIQSVAAWVQNFLLAVHAAGLAACWFAGILYCEEEIRGLLEVDPDMLLTTGITLGYSGKQNHYVPRRREFADTLRWID